MRRLRIRLLLALMLLAACAAGLPARAEDALPDVDRPFVIKTFPADNDTGIPINAQIKVLFNRQMDYLTFNQASVMLMDGVGGTVDGVISYDSRSYSLTLTPAANLTRGERYSLFIPAYLVRDVSGNAPLANVTFSFSTAEDNKDIPELYAARKNPAVLRHSPDLNATDVSADATLTFDFTMDLAPESVRADCVTLNDGAEDEPCRVYYSERDRQLLAVPARPLGAGKVYTVVLKNDFRSKLGFPMLTNYTYSFSTRTAKDETPPIVTETSPIAGGRDVSVNTRITVAFSEPMDPTSVNPKTFVVLAGDRPVDGRVMYDLRTRKTMFAPLERLKPGQKYTCLATTKMRDTAGNGLAAPVEWTFETRAEKIVIKPQVIKNAPADGERNVPADAKIIVYFNKAMSEATLNALTLSLSDPRGPVPISTGFMKGANFVTILPTRPLAWSTAYKVRVAPDVSDPEGLRLGREHVFGFTTEPQPDSAPPTIVRVAPREDEGNVPIELRVEAQLSEPVNPLTLDERTLVLRDPNGSVVEGKLEYLKDANLLALTPKGLLAYTTVYTIEIKDTLKDLAGNRMRSAKLWKFTTAQPPDTTPPAILSSRPFEGEKAVSASAVVKIFFSERIHPDAVTGKAVQVYDAATQSLHGKLAYDDALKCLVFSPEKNFKFGAAYTVAVAKTIRDLAGNNLRESALVHFTTESAPDDTRPEVVATEPKPGDDFVPPGLTLKVAFSEALNPVTVNADSVTLEVDGGAKLPCRVDYLEGKFLIAVTPLTPPPYAADLRLSVSRTVADPAGNTLASTVVVPFRTKCAPDSKPPALLASLPAHGAQNVSVNGVVRLTFDEPVLDAALSEKAVALIPARLDDNRPVPVKVSYLDGKNTVIVAPAVKLDYETDYRLSVGPVVDRAGNRAPGPVVVQFRTEVAPDREPPRIVDSCPSAKRARILHTDKLFVAFSEPIALSTVNGLNLDLRDLNGTVPSDIVWDAKAAAVRIVADAGLKPGREYFLFVGEGITDEAGNRLATPLNLHFETRPVEDTVPPRIARVSPDNGAARVAETAIVVAEASEPLDPSSVNRHTVILEEEGHAREVAVRCGKNSGRIEIEPAEPMRRDFNYRVTLTAGITDRAGNALEKPVSWAFRVGTSDAEDALDVAAVAPREGERGVAPGVAVAVNFNAQIDPASLNPYTVLMTQAGRRIRGALTLTGDGRQVVLTPEKPLARGLRYDMKLTEGLKNRTGGNLRRAREWSFEVAKENAVTVDKAVVKP